MLTAGSSNCTASWYSTTARDGAAGCDTPSRNALYSFTSADYRPAIVETLHRVCNWVSRTLRTPPKDEHITSSPKRFLVTGADGFIGSHVCEALVARGHTVTALAYYTSFGTWGWLDQVPRETLESIKVVLGDVRDPFLVRSVMKNVDVVLHLAALIGIPYSYLSPQSYVDTNVTGTLNVLEAAKDLGIGRVVQTSTSEVYGTAQFVPITEDHPLRAQSPYAASKIGADQLALSYQRSFGTPVVVMRPFNTYGPRQSARAVIPTIIVQALEEHDAVQLGSLAPTRDFNYVNDIAEGFATVGESNQGVGEVVNFGSNFEISIGDVVTAIGAAIGRELTVSTDEARQRPANSEVDRLWAANDKALSLFDWEPRYGGIEGFHRGIAETVEWFKQPENTAAYKVDTYNV
jgi:NAD dependent epimerase/dehydratase